MLLPVLDTTSSTTNTATLTAPKIKMEEIARTLLDLRRCKPLVPEARLEQKRIHGKPPTPLLSMDHEEVVAASQQEEIGLVLLNPTRGNRSHQILNNRFREYLLRDTTFLCRYIITNNERSLQCWQLLRQAAESILHDWIENNIQTLFLKFHKEDNNYQALPVSGHDWKEGGLLRMLHHLLLRIKRRFCVTGEGATSTYVYGRGVWVIRADFRVRPLTPTDIQAYNKVKRGKVEQMEALAQEGRLSSSKEARGDGWHQMTLDSVVQIKEGSGGWKVQHSIHPSRRLLEWKAQLTPKTEMEFLRQYKMLKRVHLAAITSCNLYPPRSCWEQVFTVSCSKPIGSKPCWQCRECRMRFAQATLIVVAAQGMKDTRCLPHFGAVFRHPRYGRFSIEEWCAISIEELTMVYSAISKQCISAVYVHYFLIDFVKGRMLPKTVKEISGYQGFAKKSACLLLAAMDPTLMVGIPVDRHLANAFHSLGWAHPMEKDETVISYMVEQWLPKKEWVQCNTVCAGLRQLWGDRLCRGLLIEATGSLLGKEHLDLLCKCCDSDITHEAST